MHALSSTTYTLPMLSNASTFLGQNATQMLQPLQRSFRISILVCNLAPPYTMSYSVLGTRFIISQITTIKNRFFSSFHTESCCLKGEIKQQLSVQTEGLKYQ